MKAEESWQYLPAEGNTVVGVIDSGIDYGHPEFAGRISPLSCDMAADGCRPPDKITPAIDDLGHGTFVSGIIGAATNNGIGVASVTAGRVTLLVVRVATPVGSIASTSVVIHGLIYAAERGAKVINMSLGPPCGTPFSESWHAALDRIETLGSLLVVSGGNQGGCPQGLYPHSDQRVLSVGALDSVNDRPLWSNAGQFVSIAAPGAKVPSTTLSTRTSYTTSDGTSFAAPHVTGAAALLFQKPGATKRDVMNWLMQTCDLANISVRCGGVLNMQRALALAFTGSDPGAGQASSAYGGISTLPTSSTPAPTTTTPGTATTGPVTVTAEAPMVTGRPTPPALPAGFMPTELSRSASAPPRGVAGGALTPWAGHFWLSAPQLPVAVCDGSEELIAAAKAAITTWHQQTAPGTGWELHRDDGLCTSTVLPAIILRREALGDAEPLTRLTVSGQDGQPCGGAPCWAGTVVVTVNSTLMTTADALRARLLRSFAAAAGLSELPTADDLSAEETASLVELLTTTLEALHGN